MSQTLLDIRNLTVSYSRAGLKAVDGIDLHLPGGKLGLVGESGSGKSTVGRAIMRLLPPVARISADQMSYAGTDLLSASPRALRQLRGGQIALIMQDPRYSLNPVQRIGTQIAETARLHTGAGKRAAREAAREMLDRVRIRNVDLVMDSYPHQISGGMGQRVMIAAMLLAQPRLVIADEPTSALDVSVRGEVLNLLDELVRENGSGLILISHDIRMVSAFCDRIAVMYQGRIVEEIQSLDAASHPYTRGLIAALPDPRRPVDRLATLDREAIARAIGAQEAWR